MVAVDRARLRELVAEARKRGRSQASIAKAAGIPPSQLSHLLGSGRKTQEAAFRRLAKALNVSTDVLRGDVEPLTRRRARAQFHSRVIDRMKGITTRRKAALKRRIIDLPGIGPARVESAVYRVTHWLEGSTEDVDMLASMRCAEQLVDLRFWRDVMTGGAELRVPSDEERDAFAETAERFFRVILREGRDRSSGAALSAILLVSALQAFLAAAASSEPDDGDARQARYNEQMREVSTRMNAIAYSSTSRVGMEALPSATRASSDPRSAEVQVALRAYLEELERRLRSGSQEA